MWTNRYCGKNLQAGGLLACVSLPAVHFILPQNGPLPSLDHLFSLALCRLPVCAAVVHCRLPVCQDGGVGGAFG